MEDEAVLNKVRSIAYRSLANRALTTKELHNKLKHHKSLTGVDESVIELVVEECLSKCYIDEQSIAETVVRNKKEHKFASRKLIRHELRHRGISDEKIDAAVSQQYAAEDEFPVALEFAEKKLRGINNLDPQKKYNRIGSALARKGFSGEIIGKVLRELNLKDE